MGEMVSQTRLGCVAGSCKLHRHTLGVSCSGLLLVKVKGLPRESQGRTNTVLLSV